MNNTFTFNAVKINANFINCDIKVSNKDIDRPATSENSTFDIELPNGAQTFFMKEYNEDSRKYEMSKTVVGERYDFLIRLGISRDIVKSAVDARKLFEAFVYNDTSKLNDVEVSALSEIKPNYVILKHREPKKF